MFKLMYEYPPGTYEPGRYIEGVVKRAIGLQYLHFLKLDIDFLTA